MTYIQFFADEACQNASFVVRTDDHGPNGRCGSLPEDRVNSVSLSVIYPGCTVTTYIGPRCANNQTQIFLGTCASISAASSYSVDCPDLHGTANATYTTISAASSSTVAKSLPSSTSKTPVPTLGTPTFLSSEDSTTTVESTSPSAFVTSSPTTSGNAGSSFSTNSSFAAHPSVQISMLSTTVFESPTSTPTASSSSATSSSQASMGSSKTGAKDQIKVIVPSAVIPVLFIICVIVYVFWRRKLRKGATKDKDDKKKSLKPRSLPGIGIQPSQEQKPANSAYVRTTPASDTDSTHSRFSSLPLYSQAELKNRTAEAPEA